MRVVNVSVLALLAAVLPLSIAHAGKSATKGEALIQAGAVSIPPKVIYGEDDRIDVFSETDTTRRAWAASTCALVEDFQLSAAGSGYTLETFPYRVSGLPPCEGEAFATQPVAAFCTGFMVGPDLIATAGHCADDFSLDFTRFVFGFEMIDGDSARTSFTEDQIYVGVEVVARELDGFGADYAIIRVDRPITAPGARPLAVREAGVIPEGANIGVIGHPAGLPTKLAFGGETRVRDNSPSGYFIANLDTFGGNSGSPVFNVETGLVEGILVRGEQDFVFGNNCFRSNVVSNTGGSGEDVTKSTEFAEFLSNSAGQITLDRIAYRCEDEIRVSVLDGDLAGTGSVTITAHSDAGDYELVVLEESSIPGLFEGALPVMAGAVTEENGVLDGANGRGIAFLYVDEDTGSGGEGAVTVGAVIDCVPPEILSVDVEEELGFSARLRIETSEATRVTVRVGARCDALNQTVESMLQGSHSITVGGLSQLTDYYFAVEAADPAGNTAQDNNGGVCYQFTTAEQRDYFTEELFTGLSDLVNRSVTFMPDNSAEGYRACVENRSAFPVSGNGGNILGLRDDDFTVYDLGGKTFPFFGVEYSAFYIGSNGYITFGEGDTQYSPSVGAHFDLPRIAPYFGDMFPPGGGRTSVYQDDTRVAVTFRDVPDYFGDIQSFQVELFFTGVIRMTWLRLTAPIAIVGLSRGNGVPSDYVPSDFTSYAICGQSGEGEGEGEGEDIRSTAIRIQDNFDLADDSQDGRLSYEEALAAVQLLSSDDFDTLDLDADGFLTRDELRITIGDPPCGCFCDGGGCAVFAPGLQPGIQKILADLLLLLGASSVLAVWPRFTGKS